jgi:hypothetical protein
MHVPASLRPFAFAGRIFMWVGIVLFLGVGLFSNSPAWAETTACPGQSSIPITPITIFLKYGGAPSTYGVSLCEEPDQPVEITTTLSTELHSYADGIGCNYQHPSGGCTLYCRNHPLCVEC